LNIGFDFREKLFSQLANGIIGELENSAEAEAVLSP
jgi:hypothetical protein